MKYAPIACVAAACLLLSGCETMQKNPPTQVVETIPLEKALSDVRKAIVASQEERGSDGKLVQKMGLWLTEVKVTLQVVAMQDKDFSIGVALPLPPIDFSLGAKTTEQRQQTNTIDVTFQNPLTVSSQTLVGQREDKIKVDAAGSVVPNKDTAMKPFVHTSPTYVPSLKQIR